MERKASTHASSRLPIFATLLAIATLSACGDSGGGAGASSGHPGATIDTPATVGPPSDSANRGTGRDAATGGDAVATAVNSTPGVDEAGSPDGSSNIVIVGDASGMSSCDDGAAQCGCANAIITFPLAPGVLDAASTSDGGPTDCAALCPAMGGFWFSCEPTEGGAYVKCMPECQ